MEEVTQEEICRIHDRIMAQETGDTRVLSEAGLNQLAFRANLIQDPVKRAAFLFYSLCAYPVFREGMPRRGSISATMSSPPVACSSPEYERN